VVGRTGLGMRQVVGFRVRFTGRGNFGANIGWPVATNGGLSTTGNSQCAVVLRHRGISADESVRPVGASNGRAGLLARRLGYRVVRLAAVAGLTTRASRHVPVDRLVCFAATMRLLSNYFDLLFLVIIVNKFQVYTRSISYSM